MKLAVHPHRVSRLHGAMPGKVPSVCSTGEFVCVARLTEDEQAQPSGPVHDVT